MRKSTDEVIIYEAYRKLVEKYLNGEKETKKISLKIDQDTVKGMLAKICQCLLFLEEMETLTRAEIQKYVCRSKSLFLQLITIKARNPSAITEAVDKRIEKLMKAMAHHEAEMIKNIRLQEVGGERIDIEKIFAEKRYCNKLGSTLAHLIVKEALNANSTSYGQSHESVYITSSGLKYHVKDCPYCKRGVMVATTKSLAENQNLKPCKCIEMQKVAVVADHSFVTAFIDESIYPVKWDENGREGNVGTFSYIICWGKLDSENEISEENMMAKGVDYTHEDKKIEHVSEAAIGKTLITLAYDFDFSGSVHIYTDNMAAMQNWNTVQQNAKLAKLFKSVTVSYVPREQNKEADSLGRQKMFLCIPPTTYSLIVDKNKKYDEVIGTKKELVEISKLFNRIMDKINDEIA